MLRSLLLRVFSLVLAFGALVGAAPADSLPPGAGTNPPAANRPRLVLLIAVDQLRYDYLTRFRADFKHGFDRLLREGANFTNARLEHYPTVTAVGHSTMLSGAPPSISGIIGNDWYDRETGKNVTSVGDPATKIVGGAGTTGASPQRLLVSTLADELKLSGRPSRAVGLSLKDRAAILPAGRMADGAYWYDNKTGTFVTSTWYRDELPAWLRDWNTSKPADAFAGREWLGGKMPTTPGPDLYGAVYASPFGSELLLDLARTALGAEGLGRSEGTDVLTVSFSSNDAVGHDKGPESPEVASMTRETDRIVGQLLDAVDRQVGRGNVMVAFTADHGVGPIPESLLKRKMPGGRIDRVSLVEPVEQALTATLGPGPWIEGRAGSSLYLNRAFIREKRLELETVAEKVAEAARTLPMVYRALTRGQLLRGAVPDDEWCRRVLRGYHPARSGDVEILLYPYWIGGGESTATHGTPYSYDNHIPLILMGPGFRAGRYDGAVALNDLAPTLATLLEVETPSGSSGRVLVEALAPR